MGYICPNPLGAHVAPVADPVGPWAILLKAEMSHANWPHCGVKDWKTSSFSRQAARPLQRQPYDMKSDKFTILFFVQCNGGNRHSQPSVFDDDRTWNQFACKHINYHCMIR